MPTTSELWRPALASVTQRCLPHPRGPPRTPRILSCTMLESSLPPRALVLLRSSAVEGWERARSGASPAGSRGAADFAQPPSRGPGALGLHGACRSRQEDPGQAGPLPPVCRDSASCQSRGACRLLPTTCPSAACPPATPAEDKGLHCLYPPRLAPHLLPRPV